MLRLIALICYRFHHTSGAAALRRPAWAAAAPSGGGRARGGAVGRGACPRGARRTRRELRRARGALSLAAFARPVSYVVGGHCSWHPAVWVCHRRPWAALCEEARSCERPERLAEAQTRLVYLLLVSFVTDSRALRHLLVTALLDGVFNQQQLKSGRRWLVAKYATGSGCDVQLGQLLEKPLER